MTPRAEPLGNRSSAASVSTAGRLGLAYARACREDKHEFLIIGSISVLLSACGDAAKLPDQAGIGPNPTIPPPNSTLIPTVNIAAAKGWPEGAQPTPASD